MTAFDKHGEHVERLAQATHADLVQTRQGALNSLHRWKRALADRDQIVENARVRYEQEVARAQQEWEAAPAEIEAHEAWLSEIDEQMARLKIKPKASVWDEAKRQAAQNALIERMMKGGPDAQVAAAELRKMMK